MDATKSVRQARDEERESWFYALALLAVVCAIKPGAKQAARGVTQGKPSSALGYLYAFRRVQLDCGRYVPSLNLMLRACKGLNSVFRRVFGQDSLIPDRTQPFSLGMLHAMVSYAKSGLVATWSAALHAAILVLICFCIATGTRKDEFARSHAEDTYLMRANFKLFRGPVCLPMTRANLLAARDGDFICAKSAPSKCDRNNVVWGANDMWFRIKSADPLNFAWQWVQWELAYPCPTEERKAWAAFSPTGTAAPFTGQFAAACLDTLMMVTIGPAEAALRSWHAFRVTIACALLATDRYKKDPQAGDALIQTMVRWRTPDSIRTYGKMLPSDYADNVDLVTTTDAHRAADLASTVTIDATAPRIDLEAAIAELERDARPSQKGKAPAKDGTPAKVGKAKRPRDSSKLRQRDAEGATSAAVAPAGHSQSLSALAVRAHPRGHQALDGRSLLRCAVGSRARSRAVRGHCHAVADGRQNCLTHQMGWVEQGHRDYSRRAGRRSKRRPHHKTKWDT